MIEKLIPMTEFVQIVNKSDIFDNNCYESTCYERYSAILNYSNKMIQFPKLSDFVPLDEDNEPFPTKYTWQQCVYDISGVEFKEWDGKEERYEIEERWNEYKTEKSKVLFAGFEMKDEFSYLTNGDIKIIPNKDCWYIDGHFDRIEKLEQLIQFIDIEVNGNFLKEIGI